MPPAPPPTNLDANQVLQHAFIETSGKLRVDASISPAGGATEVIISHTDDSIRLGDGTSLVTTTTIGGEVGLDVNLINTTPIPVDLHLSGAPSILNVSAPVAATEYSFSLPITTTKYMFKSRSKGTIQYAYTSGASGTTYISVPPGNFEGDERLKLTSAITIYFQSNKTSDVLEIKYWTI